MSFSLHSKKKVGIFGIFMYIHMEIRKMDGYGWMGREVYFSPIFYGRHENILPKK